MRRVVITGRGVVSPIGSGLQAFHQGLERAQSGIRPIERFDASAFPTRIAGEVRDLDLAALRLPAAEAPALSRDPKALYGWHAAQQALAEAGLLQRGSPASASTAQLPCPADRRGVVLAAGLEIFHLQDVIGQLRGRQLHGPDLMQRVAQAPPLSLLQIPADLSARCVARQLGAEGTFAVNLSACAAGTQAVGQAYELIRDGALDLCLCGGYDSMVNPLGLAGFTKLGALSTRNERPEAASRPFDAGRDGFVLGEGAAALVLESLEVARARGAPLLAEVLGYASTLDAFRVTDPADDQAGARAALQGALDRAGIRPEELDYINAHGTATPKNDPAEAAAIRAVLGRQAHRVPVSSTKSQIGHLIGAAGAVELVAVLWALEQQLLPATLNLEQPDPECELCHVPLAPRAARVHTALSSSFGFGGQNAAIVLRRPS